MLNNVIEVGRNKNAPFIAIGDESHHENIITYAYVILPRIRINKIKRELSRAYSVYGIPKHLVFHCKDFFSGQFRLRNGLNRLSRQDILKIIHHFITIMNDQGIYIRVAYTDHNHSRAEFSKQESITLRNNAGTQEVEHPLKYDIKGVQATLAKACWGNAPNGPHGPTEIDCQIFVSPDQTKVKFMGEQSRQMHNLIPGYSEITSPAGFINHIKPEILTEDLFELQGIADIAAYLFAHSLPPEHVNNAEFSDASKRIKYRSITTLRFDLS